MSKNKTLYIKIISKILSIDRRITSRNTHFAVSEIIAMVVGIGIVVAGFVALFMWIAQQKGPAKAQDEKNTKNAGNNKSEQNVEESNKKQAEQFASMLANMGNKKAEQNAKPMNAAGNNVSNFQEIIKGMSKNNNTQNNKFNKNTPNITPTINNKFNTSPPKNIQSTNINNTFNNNKKSTKLSNLNTINNVKGNKNSIIKQ